MKLFRVAISQLLKTSFGSLTDFRNIAISALIILCIGFILYYSKQVFHYQYDPEYQENLYYHSQWNYPGSARGISDGEIYKFVGYKLVQGENPYLIPVDGGSTVMGFHVKIRQLYNSRPELFYTRAEVI